MGPKKKRVIKGKAVPCPNPNCTAIVCEGRWMTWHFELSPMCLSVHGRNEQSNVSVNVSSKKPNIGQQALPFGGEDSLQNLEMANLDGGCNPCGDDEEFVFDGQNNTNSSPSRVYETAPTATPGVDFSLIDNFKEHCNRGIEQLPFSEEMKTKIELLHILKEACAPHYLYQHIWKWAQSAVDRKVQFHDAGTRESITNDLMLRYNLDQTLPITTAITLPQAVVRQWT
jgi:hypothetical protein